MAKRKCRMTAEELETHETAVKLRKMTDKQLIEAFENQRKDCDNSEERKNSDLQKLLDDMSAGKMKGIGKATACKITEYCNSRFGS